MSEQYAIDLGDVRSQYHVGLEKGLQQGIERGLEQGLEALILVGRSVLTASELRH